ncbi:hypothetical protein [Xanthomonas campestris]|uniref:hypothetical protein n=1 Tax=Xanthomonas cannabis TaxID=1885674 RepID=UPI001E64A0D7|nr:hypothetical protein [Xanthomonas campestris pv. zinniae]
MSIQRTSCRISVRSAQGDEAEKLQSGGSILAIEFESDANADLFEAARQGNSLLEDFLSAIALVNGSIFQTTTLLQVSRFGAGAEDECEFVIFKHLPVLHWTKPIDVVTIGAVKNLLAHWDGLESGHRLRRAALQYREAIGNSDESLAFQEAYIGLESMEPPLAKAAGLQPGTEEVPGSCESCGHEFIRKKTTLVGVRNFVLNGGDPKSAEGGRRADWKLINQLRNDLMHGLADPEKMGDRPHRALLATMHHLHAAICLSSHADSLVSERYVLARGATYLILGKYTATKLSPLDRWKTIVETTEFEWVAHEQYGFVPQMSFRNNGLDNLHLGVAVLKNPLSFATMDSVQKVRFERD